MGIYSFLDLMFKIKVGIGKDIHVLKRGYPLILGGVNIPYKKGLVSFTDGDSLTHSLIDAILGALNKKDIGFNFPNLPKYIGISSLELLKEAKLILDKENYKIINIDSFISCEKPKLSDYIDNMKENYSKILNIDINLISIKCGTNEKMGYIGKNKAIEALTIVLIGENYE